MSSENIKIDWVIHSVFDDEKIVYHTHGLDKHGILELELNLPLDPDDAMQHINYIAYNFIKKDIKISEEYYDNELFECPVYFKKVKSIHSENKFGNKLDVLRIIFPDEDYLFPWDDECDEEYKKQIII